MRKCHDQADRGCCRRCDTSNYDRPRTSCLSALNCVAGTRRRRPKSPAPSLNHMSRGQIDSVALPQETNGQPKARGHSHCAETEKANKAKPMDRPGDPPGRPEHARRCPSRQSAAAPLTAGCPCPPAGRSASRPSAKWNGGRDGPAHAHGVKMLKTLQVASATQSTERAMHRRAV